MSIFNILYLTGVVGTFVTVGVLLAWDEYRARHLPH